MKKSNPIVKTFIQKENDRLNDELTTIKYGISALDNNCNKLFDAQYQSKIVVAALVDLLIMNNLITRTELKKFLDVTRDELNKFDEAYKKKLIDGYYIELLKNGKYAEA